MQYSDDLTGQRQRRLDAIKKLRELGVNSYPARAEKDYSNAHVREHYSELEGKQITLAGRLMAKREHGKLIFGDLQDQSGKIQILIRMDLLEENLTESFLGWNHLQYIDVGDFIQVSGEINKTQAGEITIFVKQLKLLTKTIRPLPNTFDDKEQRFRRRYLDFTMNPERKKLFERKAKFWQVSREYMNKKGFMEMETPVLELVTGGADAKPFITHHNALDQDFYLRISSELYQKRLIGAGFEKIFVLGPNFRNEGIDDEHLQEYYQLEWYWAYADYRDNMELVRDLFRHVAQGVYGTTKFQTRSHSFDLSDDWTEIDYAGVIKEKYNVDIFQTPDEKIKKILDHHGVDLTGAVNRNRLIDNLWKLIRKTISGPAFLVKQPMFISPLAKSIPEKPELTERFQIIIAGSELGNGYSEINDPIDQLNRFLDQQKMRDQGDEEAQMLDVDYVEMLEYGMPPTSGYGHSERVFWFFEDVTAREGTLFPQMKHETEEITKKIYKGQVNFIEKTHFANLNRPDLLSIDGQVAQKWPSINVGFAIIRDVKIRKENAELEQQKKDLHEILSILTTEEIGKYPEILSYRKLYKEIGIDWHSRRPSPEALLRRIALKKGLYTINTCVDTYNLVVMKHRVSVGAFDLDHIEFPTILRLAKEGEEILLLGDTEPTKYKAGEIAYFDKRGGYNIDYNYRDGQKTAVTTDTTNIMINVDGIHEITRAQVERSLKETIENITRHCGGKVEIAGIISTEK